jgi:hypothetical protein
MVVVFIALSSLHLNFWSLLISLHHLSKEEKILTISIGSMLVNSVDHTLINYKLMRFIIYCIEFFVFEFLVIINFIVSFK